MDSQVTEAMIQLLTTQGVIAGIVMVLVQLMKQFLADKWLQVASVVTGSIVGFAYGLYFHYDPGLSLIAGFFAGAAATGIYGAAKNPIKSE